MASRTFRTLAAAFLAAGCFAVVSFTAGRAAAQDSAGEVSPPWPHERGGIAPSPRITWGRLPNGLRYAILPHAQPPGHVVLRLLVQAGSLHENDDERGYAHFVEHMAFNGTEHFPAGELVKVLQRQGAAFGPHVNADTFITHTVYKLEFPEATPANMDTGLRVLRDVADGILFERREVDRERGVIISEDLTRQSPARAMDEAVTGFLYAGMRYPDRFPGGTESSIRRARPEGLRAFYEAWYRPSRMIVVLVGDVAAPDAAARVESAFASFSARAPVRPEPETGKPDSSREVLVGIHGRDGGGGVQIDINAITPIPDEGSTLSRRRQELALWTVQLMMFRRMEAIKRASDSIISDYGQIFDTSFTGWMRVGLGANGTGNRWRSVLELVEQEVRRSLEHGFTAAEIENAHRDARAQLENLANGWSTAPASFIADAIVKGLQNNRTFTFPAETLDDDLAIIDALDGDACTAAWRAAWSDPTRRIFVTCDRFQPVPEASVREAFAESRHAAVEPPAEKESLSFAYEDFGPAGEPARRVHVADLNLWQVEFANGVRLNIKRTDFEKGTIRINTRFGTGILGEPADKPGLRFWATSMLAGGLGRHDFHELVTTLQGHVVELGFRLSEDAFNIGGRTTPTDLDLALRVIAAYLSDPAFRKEGANDTTVQVNGFYHSLIGSPNVVLACAIEPFLRGNDPRFTLPRLEQTLSYSMEELRTWVEPQMLAGPLEVGIVGDLDVEATIAAVSHTLGALPKREPRPSVAHLTWLHFPATPRSQTFSYQAADRPTSLVFYWPVHDTYTFEDRRRFYLLAMILGDRLRESLREKQSRTYAPSASFESSLAYPGSSEMRCVVEVPPKQAGRAAGAVRKVVDQLVERGVTAEELDRARAQYIAGIHTAEKDNSYWLETCLSDVQERPWRLDLERTWEADTNKATPAELNRLAARYLVRKNLFEFRIEPSPPPGS